jgi:UDP-3-O-[3-hydroxymyristoyl] N-acetylglucosamine deacetylase
MTIEDRIMSMADRRAWPGKRMTLRQKSAERSLRPPLRQRTLKSEIGCVGVGLHSGREVRLVLKPAPAGEGIVFHRTDLGVSIPARFDHVVETRLSTEIGLPGRPEARVGTIEHVMAALAGLGVDNARIEVDGPEVPILDGSAAPFVFLLDCAGLVEQEAPREGIEILAPIEVQQGGAEAALLPAEGQESGLAMALTIVFNARAIGTQSLALALNPETFRAELAEARTFTLAEEIARLHSAGRGLGGGLHNAVVVDDDRILNPEGLRRPDEFVRHKLLDAVGDLALAGAPLIGRFTARCTGHALNNRLLRTLFAHPTSWRRVPLATPAELAAAA